jgi:type I restriction enzyme, S subunit
MSYKKVHLSEICTIEKGATGITKAIEGEYPMVTMAEARTSHNEYQFDTKAVLIPLVSSSGHGHASMKRIHYQEGKFAVGSILCALIPKSEKVVNARFLYNYLHFQRESILVPLMRGAANVSLSIKSISSVEINLPPIETQISINKLVDDFKLRQDIFQTELKTQSNLLSKLRQAYLQEAVMGKLLSEPRLSGFKDDRIITDENQENNSSKKNTDEENTDEKILQSQNPKNHSSDNTGKALLAQIKSQKAELIKQGKLRKEKPLAPIKPEEILAAANRFDIPDNWVWCRLGEVCENIHYGMNASANFNKTEVRLLRITDIQDNKVEWQDVPGCDYNEKDLISYGLNENDILIARTGGTIGKSYLVKSLSVVAVFASYLIRLIPFSQISADYLKLFIESPTYWKQLYAASGGSGQPNVNGTALTSLIIPLPPLSEQKAIVAKVERLLGNISLLESENKAQQIDVQRLMGAVLQEAFGGR